MKWRSMFGEDDGVKEAGLYSHLPLAPPYSFFALSAPNV